MSHTPPHTSTDAPTDAPSSPLVARMQGFGTTIFSEMTALAIEHDAVNLGQGFPDQDPPDEVVAAAHAALDAGHHQYAPGPGVPVLRQAIAAHQERFYGLAYDPDDEVTVTFGATEAMSATILALCERDDEVVVLEPTYDAYSASIALAHAVERRVPLTPPGSDDLAAGWRLDLDRVADAIGPRTRLLIVNSPHNPTGTVLHHEELAGLARLCVEHDLIAVTDEVYEHLVFGADLHPLASFPGMRERTVTISSASKTFSATGWKVGWACATPELITAIRTVKQFVSFSGATPLQHAVAHALQLPDTVYDELASVHRRRRDLLADGLTAAGVEVMLPAATYFLVADVTPWGFADGATFCREAPAEIGVAAVPVSAFVDDADTVRNLVRFAYCKRDEVLEEGVTRLQRLGERTGIRR
jgi:N-succinyldiaminopimelate aminotransferase